MSNYGGVYEHSSRIAERAFDAGLTKAAHTPDGLSALLRAQVEAAGEAAQLALLRAYPDLAGKLATTGKLTSALATERSGAGLDACTGQEFEHFQALRPLSSVSAFLSSSLSPAAADGISGEI